MATNPQKNTNPSSVLSARFPKKAVFFILAVAVFFALFALAGANSRQTATQSVTLLLKTLSPGNAQPQPVVKEITTLGKGLELLRVSLGPNTPDLPLFSINGGQMLVIGNAFQRKGEGYEQLAGAPVPPPAKKPEIHPENAAINEMDLVPGYGQGEVLFEYVSLRCHACAKLDPTIAKVAAETGAKLYAKTIVDENDSAGLQALAVIQALRGTSDIKTYQRVRGIIHHMLAGGANEPDLASALALMAETTPDPVVKKALLARPDEQLKKEAARLRAEAEKVGIVYTPTLLVNGNEIKSAEPPELEKALRDSLLTPKNNS
jgi:protein-disulfide isomerase